MNWPALFIVIYLLIGTVCVLLFSLFFKNFSSFLNEQDAGKQNKILSDK